MGDDGTCAGEVPPSGQKPSHNVDRREGTLSDGSGDDDPGSELCGIELLLID